MANFALWDRKTLEQFAQDASEKLLALDKPCFGEWTVKDQTNRGCDHCPVSLGCIKKVYGDA